jgi:CBS domain-containing protein
MEMKVKDAMTATVKTVRPEASLKDAASILAEHRIGGLPVVDEQDHVLGVITDADILLKERAEAPHGGLRSLLHHREAAALATKVQARTVGEAMTTPAVTVEEWWPVSEAAELMIEHDVNRLPVVEERKLVGILTRHDFVRAFARSDADIEREIRDEALLGVPWTDELELAVRNGEVTLRGRLDSKYDAEALPALIRRVPGVVGVDSEVTAWDVEANRDTVVSITC